MQNLSRPDEKIAEKVLPKPLLLALGHIFANAGDANAMLVGGTGLSGFYAGHRRSDDLDIFVKDDKSHTAVVLAVKSLSNIGATFSNEFSSQQYFHCSCVLNGHHFTVDIVTDENALSIATPVKFANGVCVADLKTILAMKCSTLVSRCSEKDLFDLLWLFEQRDLSVEDIIVLGLKVDGGVNGQTLLLSTSESVIRKEACDFGIDEDAHHVFQRIRQFQKALVAEFHNYLTNKKPGNFQETIRTIKRIGETKKLKNKN